MSVEIFFRMVARGRGKKAAASKAIAAVANDGNKKSSSSRKRISPKIKEPVTDELIKEADIDEPEEEISPPAAKNATKSKSSKKEPKQPLWTYNGFKLTPEQRAQIVQTYFENHGSIRQTFRALRPFYGRHNRPSEQVIRNAVNRFRNTNSLVDNTHPQRRQTVRTDEVIAVVQRSIEENPDESIRHRAQRLGLCPSTLWKILRKDLG